MAEKTRRTPTERAQAALDKVNAELAEIERMWRKAQDRVAELHARADSLKVQHAYLAANPALQQADPTPETDPAAT